MPESINVKKYLETLTSKVIPDQDIFNKIIKIKNLIIKTKKNKSRILIFGNGGSAAIASHISVDLTKNIKVKAMNFNEADLITCFANDYGYDKWTSEALKIYSNTNDLVILISSSGSSKNIVNAAKFAKKQGNPLITLSGFKENNPLKKIGDVNVWVNSNSYNHIEMAHHIFLVAVIDCLK